MQINWLTLFTFTAILYHNDEDFFSQQGDLHIVDSFKDIESERVSLKCHLKPALVTTISLLINNLIRFYDKWNFSMSSELHLVFCKH